MNGDLMREALKEAYRGMQTFYRGICSRIPP
jgi:hypothetical protein